MTTVCSILTSSPPVVAKTKVEAVTKTSHSKIKLISPQPHKMSNNKIKNPCQMFFEKSKKGANV